MQEQSKLIYLCLLLNSSGSVKVIFRVKVKVAKPSKKSKDVVAAKLGRKIIKQIKTGRIGNIQIVPDAIKLKGDKKSIM